MIAAFPCTRTVSRPVCAAAAATWLAGSSDSSPSTISPRLAMPPPRSAEQSRTSTPRSWAQATRLLPFWATQNEESPSADPETRCGATTAGSATSVRRTRMPPPLVEAAGRGAARDAADLEHATAERQAP